MRPTDVPRNADGKPWSKWSITERFIYVLNRDQPVIAMAAKAEFEFDSHHKWRFDFAWPTVRVAVEIAGFGWGHQAQQHVSRDNEKRNAAVEAKWKVFTYDSRLLGSKDGVAAAVEQVARVICGAVELNGAE